MNEPSNLLPNVSDHIVGLAGTAFGAIGVIISVYFYFRARKLAKPRYESHVEVAIDPRRTPFTVQFNGVEVKDAIRRVRIAIWNAGNDVIRGSAIAPRDRLRVEFPESATLYTWGIYSSRDAIGFRYEVSTTSMYLDFDFLDQGDCGAVQIEYSADTNQAPKLCGSIEGVRGGFRRSTTERFLPRFVFMLLALVVVANIAYHLIFDPANMLNSFGLDFSSPHATIKSTFLVVIAALMIVLGIRSDLQVKPTGIGELSRFAVATTHGAHRAGSQSCEGGATNSDPMSRKRSSLTGSTVVEEVIGSSGLDEAVGELVPTVDERIDGADQLFDAAEGAAADR